VLSVAQCGAVVSKTTAPSYVKSSITRRAAKPNELLMLSCSQC
jgi:hypothetical protein